MEIINQNQNEKATEIFTLIDLELLTDIRNHLSIQLKDDLAILENAEMLTLLADNNEMQIALFEKEEIIRMRIGENIRLLDELTKTINEKKNHIKSGTGIGTETDNRRTD